MKTRFSYLVVLSLILTLFTGCLTGYAAMPEVVQKSEYADVGENHWAYPWVTFMTDRNYIHGYPAHENGGLDMYKPDQFITRAEFVTILYFMLNPQKDMTESFTDLKLTDWHYGYISRAVATGYMSGYGDGTVRPNAYITREEASSVVYRAFKIGKYTNTTEFADGDQISGWAYEAIMSLADLGIVVGYTGEKENEAYIQPKVNIKRAEVASLLANADKFYPATVELSEEEVYFPIKVIGGKMQVDLFPKNTSDELSVAVEVPEGVPYTVTFTKNGETKTLSPEDFAKEIFTTEELENLNMYINFPEAKKGDKITVTVSVTDHGGALAKVVGERTYEIEFKAAPTQGGGGPSVVPSHSVKFLVNGVEVHSETVTNGTKPSVVPSPSDDTQDYVWTDEDTGLPVNPSYEDIYGDRVFVTTGATVNRDRVVESLKGYQAMKGRGKTVATDNALAGDLPAAIIDTDATDGSDAYNGTNWWTNNMLRVIATNDRGFYEEYGNSASESGKDHFMNVDGYDDSLEDIYDDVARYVVDNSNYFATATVNSSTKAEYVNYFRAMIATIEGAAVNAITEYQDAKRAGNVTPEDAYNAFLLAAVTGATNTLNNSIDAESLGDTRKQEIKDMAIAYLSEIFEKAGGYDGIKTALGALDIDSATFAADVRAMIASKKLYA